MHPDANRLSALDAALRAEADRRLPYPPIHGGLPLFSAASRLRFASSAAARMRARRRRLTQIMAIRTTPR